MPEPAAARDTPRPRAGAEQDWNVLEKLFNAVMDREPSERTAFLAEACPLDTAMRDEVLSLVLAYERATGKMENAVQQSAARAVEDRQPSAGDHVGPYQLIRRLGFGGMGAVYLAVRDDDQYRKEVAVKFLHFTLATPEMLRRFRGERQILASLEHPNIARLLDGGTTASGLPYVVMEYVDGEPIDEYCSRLPLRLKLGLFRAVCAAVHYAHRSLVVHRDIKPGNILVTADGTPKLLDFGIAKLIGDGAEHMTATAAQQPLTPAYASPEQIRGETITTSADVYSLGVLLYELLAGSLPYETRDMTPAQLERRICQETPEKASARSGNRQLAGDLDNILAMAMEKAPSQRYASADQFSDDIRRYLEGFPILARRPTWRYSTAKFLGRHKTGAAMVCALALLLVAFSTGMGLLAQRANREREKSEQVTRLLVNVFSVSNPSETRGNTLTAREILDKGAADVSRNLAGQPEVRSTLLETIASVDQSLGLYTPARNLMEQVVATRRRILGPSAPETTSALVRLAELTRLKRDYAAAEKLARDSLELRRAAPGTHQAEIAESLDTLAFIVQQRGDLKTAESLFREALAIRRKLPDSLETTETLSKLGGLLQAKGDWDGADRALEETLATRRKLLGEPHALVAISLDKLGQLRFYQRDFAGAENLLRQALAMRIQLFGEKNPEVGTNLQNLAHVMQAKGDYEQAQQLYRRALQVERATLGERDIETAIALSGMASLLELRGELEQAESLYRESLALRIKLQGEENPSVARTMGVLGNLLVTRGKLDAAEPLLTRSLELRRSKLGDRHFETGEALHLLARLNAARGRSREAERLYGQASDILRGNPSLLRAVLTDLGLFLLDQKRPKEGEPLLREALDLRRRTDPGWQIASAESDLAACLIAERRNSEARLLLERSLPVLSQTLGAHSREAETARRRLLQVRGPA